MYETVIGMEVHVELQTRSKMFCGCSADHFQVAANRHICPVCTAHPGSLPVMNERAVELAAMTGIALHCQVNPHSVFARKNYVYPDLPKGYQVSQYELPLCSDGWVEITVEGQTKRIGVVRVHLEEDTGKLIHSGGSSLIDYNRAGVPLMEIVSDSSIRSAEEAYQYLVQIRQIVRYLSASTGDMEKGAMRCEANISVRQAGAAAYGTKVEVKNLNSFRAVRNAVDYETRRQVALIETGGTVRQVTVGWDEPSGTTREQRSKESSEDYRYFPEPDLLAINLDEQWIQARQAELPELPEPLAARLEAAYGLRQQDVALLTEDREIAAFFEAVVQHPGTDPRQAANWITGELFRRLKQDNIDISATRVTPAALAELIALVAGGSINQNVARDVLSILWAEGGSASAVVESRGLAQISDSSELDSVVAEVIAKNEEVVERIRQGNTKPLQFLMGQVMQATRGKANPQTVIELLERQLDLK